MRLWGGRFEKQTSGLVDDFHSSITFDQRLAHLDITGSIAHATMLGEQGVISKEDADAMVEGLKSIRDDVEAGKIQFALDAEDIHMNVEKILTERIGEAGKRLHTGRSRNDQVALDSRLYIKQIAKEAIQFQKELCEALLVIAKRHCESIMPGYTHMQRAQPVTLGHHMMAYFQMFSRDMQRMKEVYQHADVCPLGSGALAGTTHPLNRYRTQELLGFSSITLNSLDAVSDRDYVLDYIYAASVCMMHLSRFCEEMIIWSTHEFKFVEMDDSFATGSSIMPQKKNPDMAELVRGKTGRVYGDLMALLTTLKGLPLAYNKDMQEDKEAVFDAVDTVKMCLQVFSGMVATMKANTANMKLAAQKGFINATDLADYLVKKGMPFRSAYKISGTLVAQCIRENTVLEDLPLEIYKTYSDLFDNDLYEAIDLMVCVEKRISKGGTSVASVEEQICYVKEKLV